MSFKFGGRNMLEKCLSRFMVSPRTCRILGFFYAVLSLAGSILLLKYRREFVDEYNVPMLVSCGNMRVFVFGFGQFWLLSNCSLLYGVLVENVSYKKVHLYFVGGFFIGIVATFLLLCCVVFYLMVEVFDKAQEHWMDMVLKSMNFILGVFFIGTILAIILLSCILPIYYILIGGIKPNKSFKTPFCAQLKEAEALKNAQQLKIVEGLGKSELLEEVKCNA